MSSIKDFASIILEVVERIEKHGFKVNSASHYHGGFVFEFDLVTGSGPCTHEKQFRVLQDPREFELRSERRVQNTERWEVVAVRTDLDIKTEPFFLAIEDLVISCANPLD